MPEVYGIEPVIKRIVYSVALMTTFTVGMLTPSAHGLLPPIANPDQPFELGHIPECVELAPAAVDIPPNALSISIEVTVLTDGVSRERAKQIVTETQNAYSPLKLEVNAAYQDVEFSGTSASGLIQQAKDAFGGTRPRGSDVVYVLTSKNIEEDGDPATAGLADCIGGVAFPSRAFAVGELMHPDRLAIGALLVSARLSAKVMAHEVGHLMGGHHHYANCAEGIAGGGELSTGEISPCTLMVNAVDPASLKFSTANGKIVRGHAEAYAKP